MREHTGPRPSQRSSTSRNPPRRSPPSVSCADLPCPAAPAPLAAGLSRPIAHATMLYYKVQEEFRNMEITPMFFKAIIGVISSKKKANFRQGKYLRPMEEASRRGFFLPTVSLISILHNFPYNRLSQGPVPVKASHVTGAGATSPDVGRWPPQTLSGTTNGAR